MMGSIEINNVIVGADNDINEALSDENSIQLAIYADSARKQLATVTAERDALKHNEKHRQRLIAGTTKRAVRG